MGSQSCEVTWSQVESPDVVYSEEFIIRSRADAFAFATKHEKLIVLPLLKALDFPINGFNNSRITALIVAIRRSDKIFVEKLIELGADINHAVRSFTIIPLLEAYVMCRKRKDFVGELFEMSKDIFHLLLKHGANPNIYNPQHLWLVHLILIDGEMDLLYSLIEYGVDLSVVTPLHRKNLLHLTCELTTKKPAYSTDIALQMCRLLIHKRVDMNHRDFCHETPLLCTLHGGGNLSLAHELLVEGTSLDLRNNFGNTFLTRAIHYALYDHAKMAIYAGALLRANQCCFRTPTVKTYDNTLLMNAIYDYERFVKFYETYLNTPRKLKDIARLTIRKQLPCPISVAVTDLNERLPQSLIKYLLLDEMKHILQLDIKI
ncbi:unnamed protein product [Didymodactylos carnosus]|uniref:SOCS box domain-containing protein n=1 Tax=Didymodactylos carnosus TaxID=1234261 RepID=A0A813TQV6_9BILA|nr:unnamed protein product [Didymodactylos carnosus]CAF0812639.1 unnamed protein product [Didymodactylos carnosus]CAF3570569.1 unnamed protein product [Didymodactylos carnosus]CAF3598420.1 unnamed protein product [Didymodactylos carnosus]